MLIVKCQSGVGKKACVWQQRWLSRWQAAKLLLVRWMSRYDAESLTRPGNKGRWCYLAKPSGNLSRYFSRNLSRWQASMACFLPSRCKFYCMQARSRYKLSRSHIPIAIWMSWYNELYYLQWSVSGFKVESDPGRWLRVKQKA
jgi:hypothetical protein